jgi:hypothetical protein
MGTIDTTASPATTGMRHRWLAAILIAVGLLGHLLSAHYIGGGRIAYTHHILGFVLILVVTGLVIVGVGWLAWRGRHHITLVTIGAVQALLGVAVYVLTVRTH